MPFSPSLNYWMRLLHRLFPFHLMRFAILSQCEALQIPSCRNRLIARDSIKSTRNGSLTAASLSPLLPHSSLFSIYRGTKIKAHIYVSPPRERSLNSLWRLYSLAPVDIFCCLSLCQPPWPPSVPTRTELISGSGVLLLDILEEISSRWNQMSQCLTLQGMIR